MILSRLTRAVREQNWFAVVLEFVIVVCGVLLAFQFSTWSNEADERAYARDVLARLYGELNAVGSARSQGAEQRSERLRNLIAARPIILGAAQADEISPAQCAAIAYAHYTVGSAPDSFPSLDELMTSGAVESLRSDSVRQAAMELFSKRAAVRRVSARDARRTIDILVGYPDAIQATLIPNPDEDNDGWDRSASCDLDAMRADPSFQAAFLANTEAYRAHVEFVYRFLDEAIATLRDALAAELNLDEAQLAPGVTE